MTQGKKVAIVLSGCGVDDGAEIHESVLTMLALDRAGVEYFCFAPDIAQRKVVDHYHKAEVDEKTSEKLLIITIKPKLMKREMFWLNLPE